MKLLTLSLLLLYSTIIQAVEPYEESCSESATSPLEEMLQTLERVQLPKPSPDMSYTYTLAPDCSYNVTSYIEFPSIAPFTSFDVFTTQFTDTKVNLASADRSRVLDMKITKQGKNFKQVTTAKKNGIKAEIISYCTFTNKTNSSFDYNCIVEPEESKTKGLVSLRLFEHNETTISCKLINTIKCTIKTTGKAKSIMVKSSCDLAAPGAAETLETTYRLSHYLAHGNVNNIQAGKALVDRFYSQAKDHKSIGKSTFKISGDL